AAAVGGGGAGARQAEHRAGAHAAQVPRVQGGVGGDDDDHGAVSAVGQAPGAICNRLPTLPMLPILPALPIPLRPAGAQLVAIEIAAQLAADRGAVDRQDAAEVGLDQDAYGPAAEAGREAPRGGADPSLEAEGDGPRAGADGALVRGAALRAPDGGQHLRL